MSTPRRLGVFLCIAGLITICVLALVLNTSGPFAGLNGIESSLESQARAIVSIPDAAVNADGRTLRVELPEQLDAAFDREGVLGQLRAIDGVRSVELLDGATADAVLEEQVPGAAPTPTEELVPTPASTPEPAALTLGEVVDGLDVSQVAFAPELARLTAGDEVVLDDVATQLRGQTGGPVEIQVHTDNVGDPDANFFLSQGRAEAVADYLIDRGVDPALLVPRGYGASAPIADNNTEQGRADNRRVVFVVEGN